MKGRNKMNNIAEKLRDMSHWVSDDGQDLVMVADVLELLGGNFMKRITKYDKQLNNYVFANSGKKYSEKELIEIIGKLEDTIEDMTKRSGELIESMMQLMEITKGEKEDLMKKLQSY